MSRTSILHGTVTDMRTSGGGPSGRSSTYIVEGEDGNEYAFDYTDIVRETFRAVTTGERVRFVPNFAHSSGLRATYVIMLSDFSDLFYRDLEPPTS